MKAGPESGRTAVAGTGAEIVVESYIRVRFRRFLHPLERLFPACFHRTSTAPCDTGPFGTFSAFGLSSSYTSYDFRQLFSLRLNRKGPH